jgi:hypothetical protein
MLHYRFLQLTSLGPRPANDNRQLPLMLHLVVPTVQYDVDYASDHLQFYSTIHRSGREGEGAHASSKHQYTLQWLQHIDLV